MSLSRAYAEGHEDGFIEGAALALAVERILAWLRAMAALGLRMEYQAEVRRLRDESSDRVARALGVSGR